MAKRWMKSFFTKAMQRQVGALTRNALRAGKKASQLATKVPTRKRKRKSAVPATNHWRTGIAASPGGLRRYHLFHPTGKLPSSRIPLVVMLHGCGQDARSFATSTHMNRLAASAGFMVLYPEQDRVANVQGCWNWFDTRSGRALREATSILSVVDHICATYPVDARRVVVAGMSAGASMAALIALHHPERFLAVAMHSGIGPGMAESTATALTAMRGRIPKSATSLHAPATPLPALLVIQGNRDTVVAPSNGALAAQRWAATVGAKAVAPRTVQRGTRYAVTLYEWKVGRRAFATLAEVAGLGHAWSGGAATQAFSDPAGPDASRMVWAFAQREHTLRGAARTMQAG
ncbi:PHB depolymerase family esterase [Rhodoferax saidenbachensis]|uniref:Poly(Hydroxyalkanoate) depolymerase family esterase n=1 Tax=Rhodoferax saidenbachensis TaxID=1484693 RepID=A0ABU1ZKQ6_9BURK|nr:PHB depolymerase family esterase [Rhodoferax saidenbachensis]MDR7306124.1 poly(hydroxyalkanoate) depolymerase family esterase [Rhodoferax saidenbachensis]